MKRFPFARPRWPLPEEPEDGRTLSFSEELVPRARPEPPRERPEERVAPEDPGTK